MRSIFLVIIREIGQKCPKKYKNALKMSKNALKSIKSAKNAKKCIKCPKNVLWLEHGVPETYL